MADEKARAQRAETEPLPQQGQGDQGRAAREEATQRAKQEAAASGQPDPQSLPGGGELSVDEHPLEGFQPFGVAQAGSAETHERLVGSDQYAHASEPGTPEGEHRTGKPLPEAAADAMQARLAAGIPEPPKVGPYPTTTLYDTPGGYQAVPAGTTPNDLARALRGNGPGHLRAAEVPEELGADVRHVAGPAPGSVSSG